MAVMSTGLAPRSSRRRKLPSWSIRASSPSPRDVAASRSVVRLNSTTRPGATVLASGTRSEEHTSELQSQSNLVCRLLLEKKKMATTSSLHFEHMYTTNYERHYI